MFWIFPLALLILFELIADIFSKEWTLRGHWMLWTGAVLAYLTANIFWLFALRGGLGLARGGMIFAVACAILAVVLGIIFYKEETNIIQLVGMGIGIVSLILIFY